MMKTHFLNEESTPEDNEQVSELAAIHHVSILDDLINEHEKEMSTPYFLALRFSGVPRNIMLSFG